MFKTNKLIFGILFFILLLLTGNILVFAAENIEEINLEKAFEIAKSNNIEINEARKNYENSKNEIKSLNKSLDWKFSLNNSFAYNNGDEYKGLKDDFNLFLNRKYYSGLSLSSTIGIIEKEPFEFNNLEDKLSYNLNLSLPLYPQIATESEKNFVLKKDNLEIAKMRLDNIIKQKEINWLEDYLSILRLKESVLFMKEKEKLLLDNLSKIEEEYEMGEIGKYNLVNAKISIKEQKIRLEKMENQLQQEKDHFYNNLGIKEKYKIKFSKDDNLLKKSKEKAENEIFNNNLESIYSKAKGNDIELISLNKELKRKEDDYKDQKKKNGIEIKTNTNYKKNIYEENGNLEISIGLSWDIFDEEIRNINLDNFKREVDNLKDKNNFRKNSIVLEVNMLLNEKEIYKMQKENIYMKLESARLEMKNSKIKYKEDLITRVEYIESEFKYREIQNEKFEIEDKLFINDLEVLNLIGEY